MKGSEANNNIPTLNVMKCEIFIGMVWLTVSIIDFVCAMLLLHITICCGFYARICSMTRTDRTTRNNNQYFLFIILVT